MFKETARVRWFDGITFTLCIDCPNTPGGCALREDCIFHNRDLFDSFVRFIYGCKFARTQKIVVTMENDSPVIEVKADNFPSFMTTKTIMEMISAFRLPRLKTICRKMLFKDTSDSHQLFLFKALLRRKYDIPAEDLDTVETQTNLLLK